MPSRNEPGMGPAATHPRLCVFIEDGLRPTVPSARDLSVLDGEVNRVLQ